MQRNVSETDPALPGPRRHPTDADTGLPHADAALPHAGPDEAPHWSERQRISRLYLAFAIVLIPWTVYLAITLPERSLARHYDFAWVGYDCIIVLALARTAYLAWKGSPAVVMPAVATATLLLADAWFDVITSSGHDRVRAIVLALLIELPTAALSFAIARRTLAHLHWAEGHAPSEQADARNS